MTKSKSTLVNLRQTVRAWVADATQARDISTSDLTILQSIFEEKLNVVHTNDGGIAIFPHDLEHREAFDAFMEANGLFTERPIQITTI
jgi:hypothetical protein